MAEMAAPLEGIKVVEVANWLAAPSAAALMRDLGADVIKVEPPGGDVYRGLDLRVIGYDHDFALNYGFELDNRGKRSVAIALDRPGGPELVHRLCERADLFLTNLTQPRRERYRLTEDAVCAVNPRIVYTSLTGYGTRGPDATRPGFDYAAFWARSGIMGTLGEPPSAPPLCRGGQGDHSTALNVLAASLAALRLRDRTREGHRVDVTLYETGIWTIGADFSAALVSRQQPKRHDRNAPANPIWNSYSTSDERWILLVMVAPDPYWPRFCATIGKPDWASDERYDSGAKRAEHTRELTREISERFAAHPYAYWARRLDEHGLIWAPVAELPQVIDDAQARELGVFETIEHPKAGPFETLRTPFSIRDADIAARGPAPETGAHTREVLAELELGADEIAELSAKGVIG
jgi:crotonobetainyl-CoA:carnitine CoA-transferase CaiB-like acyl-CoA transferase